MDVRRRSLRLLGALALAALATGCAMQAPPYSPLVDNAEALRKGGAPAVAVGTFTVQPGLGGASSIGLRGASMNSPVGSDYAAYLADALQRELSLAGKLDPKSRIVITGVLLKNDIAAGGISTNSGEIEASFVVVNDGQERYRRTHRAEASWDSSFVGAVAVPRAAAQYPLLVQKLLGQLFSDAAFAAALR
jgi:hypothetical protein